MAATPDRYGDTFSCPFHAVHRGPGGAPSELHGREPEGSGLAEPLAEGLADPRLADVAVAAGFCDQSHMTRAFKQQLGRTPAVI